jgi:acetate kinase
MSDVYTKEELKSLSRTDLRRRAVQVLNVPNRDVISEKSDVLINKILAFQDTQNIEVKSKPEVSKSETNKDIAQVTMFAPSPEEHECSNLVQRIDAVGKTVDQLEEKFKQALSVLEEKVTLVLQDTYIIIGLAQELYKLVGEPDDLQERMKELIEGSGRL